jgi:hypothetical protein
LNRSRKYPLNSGPCGAEVMAVMRIKLYIAGMPPTSDPVGPRGAG